MRNGMKPSSDGMGIRLKSREFPVSATDITLLDDILQGGFRKDSIIHLYGEPGSGRTTFVMQLMSRVLKAGWRGIWIDCNGAFSPKRLMQILDTPDSIQNLMQMRPNSSQHQTLILQNLQHILSDVGLVVVDPITHFYRAERYRAGSQGFFQELIDTQMGILVGVASQKIPVVVVNYATKRNGSALVPLVERGFHRYERYRLLFQNIPTFEEDPDVVEHGMTIEISPDPYSRNREFIFTIGSSGIENFRLADIEDRDMEDDMDGVP